MAWENRFGCRLCDVFRRHIFPNLCRRRALRLENLGDRLPLEFFDFYEKLLFMESDSLVDEIEINF
jgi:hypothetical protein